MRRALLFAALVALGCRGGKTTHAYRPATGGEPERGAQLIRSYGCGACHTVPGIRGANGVVAPPLTQFAQRTFIAGELPNTPQNLVRWIRDPHSVEKGTAMPALGLSDREARDVAAYLYELR